MSITTTNLSRKLKFTFSGFTIASIAAWHQNYIKNSNTPFKMSTKHHAHHVNKMFKKLNFTFKGFTIASIASWHHNYIKNSNTPF